MIRMEKSIRHMWVKYSNFQYINQTLNLNYNRHFRNTCSYENESGLIQMIRLEKSIRHMWVK